MKRVFAVLLTAALALSCMLPVMAESNAVQNGDIVILYTNDVHTHIEGELSYADAAGLKNYYEAQGHAVLLVDAGDHVQGTAYGAMDNGETIVQLMNAADYDVASLGNHEFDYGMNGCMQVLAWADYDYLSCNFYHEKNGVAGETVVDSYRVFDLNGLKVAIIGVITPEAIKPAIFQNEDGAVVYGIAGGEDGELLYKAVQDAIDAAKQEADVIIGLGHLGVDFSSGAWTSKSVIENTEGLDVFIDGHSHTSIPEQMVMDEGGNPVLLTQTGELFSAIGCLTISADGRIKSSLITENHHEDTQVKAMEAAWMAEIDNSLGKVIGYTDNVLDNYAGVGDRRVRKESTNTGNFTADALYYLFDSMEVDVAVMNGGGIRNKAVTGELSYLTCKNIHTFGNIACMVEVTGQQLLDMLEWGSWQLDCQKLLEMGSLLHPSGMTYEVHTYIPYSGEIDENLCWVGSPSGEYRVQNVQIRNRETGVYEPLDKNKTYRLAGYNYILRNEGDGFAMLEDTVNVVDYVMEDYMVLANYIQSFPVDEKVGLPKVTGYEHTEERIKLCNVPTTAQTRLDVVELLYQQAGSPAVAVESPFADAKQDAVAWAFETGIVNGVSEGSFAPDALVKRQELVTMLYRWAEASGKSLSVEQKMNVRTYVDGTTISDYALPAVQWASDTGLLVATYDWIRPMDAVAQADAQTLVAQYTKLK